MVGNYFVKVFSFLSCLIGNTLGEGVMSKNYRFKIFSKSFLDSTSVKTDTPDLFGEFKQDQKFKRPTTACFMATVTIQTSIKSLFINFQT